MCERILISRNLKDINFNETDLKILNDFTNNYSKTLDFTNNQDINGYLNFIAERLFASNKYFNDEEPWNKNDKQRLNTIIYVSLELIKRKNNNINVSHHSDSALKVLNIFDINEDMISLKVLKIMNF